MIFLSHSGTDKPLVEEIAFELVNEGINVWLDKWEMENGDFITQKILTGINDSDFVVIFLSPESLESKWVKKELEKAIEKELEIGRKFLLLVKLRPCILPEEIEGRVYLNFSASFTLSTNQLVKLLKAKTEDTPVPEKPLIPIRINNIIHVDTHSLIRLFTRINDSVVHNGISKEQLLIIHDKEYADFKMAAYQVFDDFKSKRDHKATHYFKETLKQIDDYEELLTEGIVRILSQCENFSFYNLISSVGYFAKSILVTIGATIDQLCGGEVERFVGTKLYHSPFGSNSSFNEFYQIESITKFQIWMPANQSDYISFWVSDKSLLAKDFEDLPFPRNFREVYDPAALFEYLIPQMVRSGLRNPRCPIWWNFNDAKVGRG